MGNSMTREKIDYNGEIDLRHFELLRCVGKGAFGKVRIVEKKDTKQLYALKYINKMQCIKMRAVPNIFRERAILEEIDHPFVVNLRFAFQDDENMFMVLDLMNGGDVRYHLDRLGGFSPDVVRFIAMELVCALSYLHKKHIVHRDLKPDNVLFDKDGHVHLTDFNIAVHYNIKRLTSQSGTLSYMAPEVFTKTGYSWPIDWWSLGIFLYEALFGKRPFRGQTDEELRDNICHQDLHVPIVNLVTNKPVALSSEGENLLRRLLERDVRKRIGCGTMGVEEIEAHPWFRGIDWDTVQRMKYQPTFVPDPNQANFDPTFDLEELLLDDNPLNYRPRKKKVPKQGQQTAASVGLSPANTTPNSRPLSHNGQSKKGQGPEGKRKLTPKERLQLDLDYIDANFKLFDSSVFERYNGFVDPSTMTVSDEVPSWVRNVSHQAVEENPPPIYFGSLPASLVGSPSATPLSHSNMGSQEWKPPPPPSAERFRNGSRRPSASGPSPAPSPKSTRRPSFPGPSAAPPSPRIGRSSRTTRKNSHPHIEPYSGPVSTNPWSQYAADLSDHAIHSRPRPSPPTSYNHRSRSMTNLQGGGSRPGDGRPNEGRSRNVLEQDSIDMGTE